MTDPIGTAQERELIEPCPFCGCEASVHEADSDGPRWVECDMCGARGADHQWAENAISAWGFRFDQSRIAEVGRLTEALDDCVASLAAIRATADNPDEWALSAEHFSTVCLESLKVARDALSLQRRV